MFVPEERKVFVSEERTVLVPKTVRDISGLVIDEGAVLTNVEELERTYRGYFSCCGCTWLVEVLKEHCIETREEHNGKTS